MNNGINVFASFICFRKNGRYTTFWRRGAGSTGKGCWWGGRAMSGWAMTLGWPLNTTQGCSPISTWTGPIQGHRRWLPTNIDKHNKASHTLTTMSSSIFVKKCGMPLVSPSPSLMEMLDLYWGRRCLPHSSQSPSIGTSGIFQGCLKQGMERLTVQLRTWRRSWVPTLPHGLEGWGQRCGWTHTSRLRLCGATSPGCDTTTPDAPAATDQATLKGYVPPRQSCGPHNPQFPSHFPGWRQTLVRSRWIKLQFIILHA